MLLDMPVDCFSEQSVLSAASFGFDSLFTDLPGPLSG